LSEDLIRIFEKELNNLIERTIKTGIILVEERLNVDEMGLYKVQNDVYLISKRLKTLKGLYKKIQKH